MITGVRVNWLGYFEACNCATAVDANESRAVEAFCGGGAAILFTFRDNTGEVLGEVVAEPGS